MPSVAVMTELPVASAVAAAKEEVVVFARTVATAVVPEVHATVPDGVCSVLSLHTSCAVKFTEPPTAAEEGAGVI